MKKRILAIALAGALMAVMLGALAACGGASSGSAAASGSGEGAAQATEFSFFSVVVPEGYEADAGKHLVSKEGGGSFAVSVYNAPAEELLATELKDADFAQGDDLKAGDFTWKVAHSDKWDQTYYIADWEDGCVEVNVKGVADDDVVKGFLGTLKPAEDAYAKWQQASK